jgi:predicted nucleic acid-binding protein
VIFIDTCILIDYAKGNLELDFSKNYFINSIVQLEFKVGALNKRELKKINQILSNFKLVELDQDIFDLADNLIEKYALSHNMAIYDAIIAATCLVYDLRLWALNKKDFRFIDELKCYDNKK